MDNDGIVRALLICARTSPCPNNCPRYGVGEDGEECARRLMEEAAAELKLIHGGAMAGAGHCLRLQKEVDAMASELADSQRREKAAVEDVEAILKQDYDTDKCWACEPDFDCGKERVCKPKWRGPQGEKEASPNET